MYLIYEINMYELSRRPDTNWMAFCALRDIQRAWRSRVSNIIKMKLQTNCNPDNFSRRGHTIPLSLAYSLKRIVSLMKYISSTFL